ncbi:hypothetical protein LPN04_29655 [Rugamonas sp. A1-17]|nr:hypothetical protein [Rugamonas sp. A1-17]
MFQIAYNLLPASGGIGLDIVPKQRYRGIVALQAKEMAVWRARSLFRKPRTYKFTLAPSNTFPSRHVGVAAEAFAAAVFAQCGLDISVQYGANQPEYDLIVARGELMLKVSVKGSKDGWWGLTQSLLREAQYRDAVDEWRKRHKPKTIFCLVQFANVEVGQMARIYLATPDDVADRLRAASGGRGDTILYESHVRGPRAAGAGILEKLPDAWRFSTARVEELLQIVS